MKQNVKSLLLASIVISTVSACSWVDPKPGSELVIMTGNVGNCKLLAETEVSVKHTILWWDRERSTIEDELRIMARNAALQKGGNAISPSSEIREGRQSFKILSCPSN